MKRIFKIGSLVLTLALFLAACDKIDKNPTYTTGNAVVLSASATTLTPAIADSNNTVVTFNWTTPNYAQDTSLYKFIVEIDSAGRNFSYKTTKIVTGAYTASLTGRDLNAILVAYGFTIGSPYDLEVRVTSSYNNNNDQYVSNVVRISVTPFNDPSILTSSETSVTGTLATANDQSLVFSWTRSFTGYTGDIDYTIEYDSATDNFASPTAIAVGVGILVRSMTQGEINQSAITSGIVGGTSGTVEYRIKAVTALGAVSYSNTVSVNINTYISILRFYMPGSYQASTGNGLDWDPPTAPELIRDLRTGLYNDMYYIYIYLPANAEFKFTQGRSWSINYGGAGGLLSTTGANLSVPTAGFYRITIKMSTMEYNIMEGRMGFVGDGTGAGWNPPNTFPTYALGNAGTNLFVGLTDFTAAEWKLIDNNAWNSGNNAVDETRGYGTSLPSGSSLEVNGGNFAAVTTPGRYRAIWDGRDRDNVKYEFSDGAIMKVVGDGLTGVAAWTPAVSPLMTYAGNHTWTITLPLEANKDFKFLAGADWGAFDYEDNSGQNAALAVPRKIKWEGGDNFKTPATAGTYTITLNEGTQTVTVN